MGKGGKERQKEEDKEGQRGRGGEERNGQEVRKGEEGRGER